MNDVIDALIENHHVNDVTEECTKNAHTIQNVISIDQVNDKTDDENLTLSRYWFTFILEIKQGLNYVTRLCVYKKRLLYAKRKSKWSQKIEHK